MLCDAHPPILSGHTATAGECLSHAFASMKSKVAA